MRVIDPALPKELLPLGHARVIDFALSEARYANIQDVIVILRPGKERLLDHLNQNQGPYRLHIVWQDQPRGEVDALLQAWNPSPEASHVRDLLNHPVAVLYPDNIGHPSPGMLQQVCKAFQTTGCDTLALMRVTPENAPGIGNSGRIELASENTTMADPVQSIPIAAFHPKGTGPFPLTRRGELRTCGLFVTLPHFFEYAKQVRQTGFHGELTDGKVRRAMLKKGVPFQGVPLQGTVYDVGNPTGYGQLQTLLRHG
jgi:UTP--glucose-1-phosphate uridylyltransferase